MKSIQAKIIDENHLELNQPLDGKKGVIITVYIPEEDDLEDMIWKKASEQNFLKAYDEQDSIYDDL